MRQIIFLFALLLVCTGLKAQEVNIQGRLDEYTKYTLDEEIYIHTDRPNYWNNEIIWFKAYVTAGAFHKPTVLSKTLYVELIDENNEVLSQKVLNIKNGLAHGDFIVQAAPKNIKYKLRAYTNWMKNRSQEHWFWKEIPIEAQRPAASFEEEQEKKIASIDFFPEGGNLLADVVNNVAFKAIDEEGKGVKVSGGIYDEDDELVVVFVSEHKGMGTFQIDPYEDQKLYAKVDGLADPIPLPSAMVDTYTLSTNGMAKEDQLVILAKTNKVLNKPDTLWFIGQSGADVIFKYRINFNQSIMPIVLKPSELPEGIVQLTLMNKFGEGISERLVFNRPKNSNANALLYKEAYGLKEKVTLSLAVEKAANASLSLSTYDSRWAFFENQDIKAKLLLTDDLKGSIEDPISYFEESNKGQPRRLDLLMMVNGWRKFTLQSILTKGRYQPLFQPEIGFTLSGQMTTLNEKRKMKDGRVVFNQFGIKRPVFESADVDEDGNFFLTGLEFYDDEKSFLQGYMKGGATTVKLSLNDSKVVTEIEIPENLRTPEPKTYSGSQYERRPIVDLTDAYLSNVRILESVEVVGERERDVTPNVGPGDDSLDFEEIFDSQITAKNIGEIIVGRVSGVYSLGTGPGMSAPDIRIRGTNSVNAPQNPLILVDNVVSPYEVIATIAPSDVKKVEIYKTAGSTAIFGTRGSNGVISIFTKRGGDGKGPTQDQVNQGRVYLKDGYYTARTFYSPKYNLRGELIGNRNKTTPDNRIQLHWEPNITLDEDGKAEIEFWTSEKPGVIQIDIQGITPQGKLISMKKSFEVLDGSEE